MSNSARPHRRPPTQLHRPWDSPGKNTGMGCHFLLQSRKGKSESEVAQSCPTLCDPMDWSPPGPSVHRIFQARVLEWVATAFSSNSLSSKVSRELLSLFWVDCCLISKSKVLTPRNLNSIREILMFSLMMFR